MVEEAVQGELERLESVQGEVQSLQMRESTSERHLDEIGDAEAVLGADGVDLLTAQRVEFQNVCFHRLGVNLGKKLCVGKHR